MTTYTAPTIDEYCAAWQTLYGMADEHVGNTARRAAQFLFAIANGGGEVDIQGIAGNFDRSNIRAVCTVLSGFQRHHIPAAMNNADTMRRLAQKAKA